MTFYLGIDTSAYTTSLALVDDQSGLVRDERLVLKVKSGARGLRQSEALFQHIKNLPRLFSRLSPEQFKQVRAIAVSAAPRNSEDSYMPVFLAGLSQARSLSYSAGIPLYQVSHQEGHIMAGMQGNKELLDKPVFLAVHFSGGTSDILYVTRGKNSYYAIANDFSGTDLHAGQLVDRVGVALGLPFPAGQSLEKLALQVTSPQQNLIPSSVNSRGFSFSGAETRALQLVQQGINKADIASSVLRVIANTLEKSLLRVSEKRGVKDVLLVGGVMANSIIRKRLRERLEHPAVGMHLYFTDPIFSTDNAVGVAMLAAALHQERKACGA